MTHEIDSRVTLPAVYVLYGSRHLKLRHSGLQRGPDTVVSQIHDTTGPTDAFDFHAVLDLPLPENQRGHVRKGPVRHPIAPLSPGIYGKDIQLHTDDGTLIYPMIAQV
jgi:hypothetical protein